MRPSQVTQIGVGASIPVPVDIYCPSSFKGIFCDVTGASTYTVQITGDDIFDSSVTPLWLSTDVAALTGATTDQQATITTPCRAIRINQTVGVGSTRLVVIQQSVA